MVLLPSEHRAEQGEGFARAGGRLEQRVAVSVSLGAIERGDDAAHEGELGAVGLVRELDLEASDLVDVFGGFGLFRFRIGGYANHFFVVEILRRTGEGGEKMRTEVLRI